MLKSLTKHNLSSRDKYPKSVLSCSIKLSTFPEGDPYEANNDTVKLPENAFKPINSQHVKKAFSGVVNHTFNIESNSTSLVNITCVK